MSVVLVSEGVVAIGEGRTTEVPGDGHSTNEKQKHDQLRNREKNREKWKLREMEGTLWEIFFLFS